MYENTQDRYMVRNLFFILVEGYPHWPRFNVDLVMDMLEDALEDEGSIRVEFNDSMRLLGDIGFFLKDGEGWWKRRDDGVYIACTEERPSGMTAYDSDINCPHCRGFGVGFVPFTEILGRDDVH